jgi:glycosyltransferase involved in cell wall biosynthesis
MPDVLAASDACIAILKNIPMFRTTYPNKVFDYMAAGRPTILAIDGVIRDVIESANGGIFTPPGDDAALANAIASLADDPVRARQMGADARKYVVQNFNRADQALSFLELLHSVAGARVEVASAT